MIYIDCNNEYFKENLLQLFRQVSLDYFFENKNENCPFSINIFFYEKYLRITKAADDEIKLQLPSRFDQILDVIEKLSKKFFINISYLKYFPLNQSIHSDEKIIKLNLIHNKILMQLSLRSNGIPKSHLYNLIWPTDKDYSINKLDTHVTNLKNLIIQETDLKINFESYGGILKLII